MSSITDMNGIDVGKYVQHTSRVPDCLANAIPVETKVEVLGSATRATTKGTYR